MKAYINWALSKKWWRAWAFWIPVVVIIVIVLLVWLVSGIDTDNTDYKEMITVITYGHGEKIQVEKGVLYGIGFMVWMLVLSLANRS
jgi:hypothetical protein